MEQLSQQVVARLGKREVDLPPMAKLPKTLHVKFADGGTGPDWFQASADMLDLIELGEKVTVGIYQLIETTVAEGVVSTGQSRRVRK